MYEGALLVHGAPMPRLQLIAEALSKSVMLAHYETRIASDFDRIEPLARGAGAKRAHARRTRAIH